MKNRFHISLLVLGLLIGMAACSRAPATSIPQVGDANLTPNTLEITSISPDFSPNPPQITEGVSEGSPAYPAPPDANPPVSLPSSTSLPVYPGPVASSTSQPPSPTEQILTETATQVVLPTDPEPSVTPTPFGAYPPPVNYTPTAVSAYPGPGSPTPARRTTASPTSALTTSPGPSITPNPSPTPRWTGTPPAIPVEIPPVPASTPPPTGSVVRIYHSWSYERAQALDVVINAFQDVYPSIRFDVTYIPQVDLRSRYEAEAYQGGGPNLLFAPADWGPAYYDSQLVSDLTPFSSPEFLAQINPAALGTGRYHAALISLPIAQSGVVLFRNIALIPTAPQTFADLIQMAQTATRGGNLGAYFDRGAFYSAGNLAGLGGGLMDADQNPIFNRPAGLAWFDLLEAYDVAGAAGINTNRDLELFQSGRIGFIIETTGQIPALADALGSENLAIDPWPAFGSGHLSGFVQAESVYLNPNVHAHDQMATLLFMGYLLTGDVQQYLAEFGMIPAALDANPRPFHIAQAAIALEGGMPYPPVADPHVLIAYWDGLEMAIDDVFIHRINPQTALDSAEDLVLERLRELNP
jgi:ABC-type glycerol-3-phosphate transport system substrate-binding protein